MDSERKEIASITILEDDIPMFEATLAAFNVVMQSYPNLTPAQRDRIEKRFYEEIQKAFALTEEKIQQKLGGNE
jgi:ABC-type transporter MlaC component